MKRHIQARDLTSKGARIGLLRSSFAGQRSSRARMLQQSATAALDPSQAVLHWPQQSASAIERRTSNVAANLVKYCALPALILLASLGASRAAILPSGFTETQIASGASSPTAFAFAPDGRLFVCQQGGQLRVIKNGTLLGTPFVTVNVDSSGERGLLGVTFDPAFTSNQFVYVYYTVNSTPRSNRVSRFTANGDVAVPGSEVLILQLENLSSATNHNGGAIHFGPDGKLYVAVGENANSSNAQTLSNKLGKLLRLNADGTIPSDNPFFGAAAGDNRSIFAYGLRNPFTFAFQPGTGRMFINDVGQSSWEEINDGIAGANYGWPTTEGATSSPSFRSPLLAYGHGNGSSTGCAIAGGSFYNPSINRYPPQYTGQYFYAEYCSGWIRLFTPASGQATGFATSISNPVDLTVGPDGYLYYLARGGGGTVYRISFTASSPCDLTFDGSVNVVDIQRLVLVVLGVASGAGSEDLNGDTLVNVADVQRLVNTALGGSCS
jgi:glucose/arabinose dehydrogenase